MIALHIEDNAEVRALLQTMLKSYCPEITDVHQADGVASGIKSIHQLHPDVVFLDGQLKDGNALELLRQIEYSNFQLIFLTAYNEFAIEAFKFSAIDYLLKPIDAAALIQSVQRAVKNLKSEHIQQQFEVLTSHLRPDQSTKKIVLRNSDTINFVEIQEIVRCEADGSYTKFITTDGQRIIVSRGLKDFEALLKPHDFSRVHHSHLVNLHRVKRLEKANGFLVMNNEEQVPLSSRKREAVLGQLQRIAGSA